MSLKIRIALCIGFFSMIALNMARFSRSFDDWGWMLSVWAGSCMLVSPALAGVVAVAIATRWSGRIEAVARGFSNPLTAPLHLTWLALQSCWTAQMATLIIGTAISWSRHAITTGVSFPYQLVTAFSATLASSLVAMAVITVSPAVLNIPILVVGLFVAHIAFFETGMPEPFSPDIPTVPMSPMKLEPGHQLANLFSSLLFGLASVSAVEGYLAILKSSRLRAWIICIVALACVIIVTIWNWRNPQGIYV